MIIWNGYGILVLIIVFVNSLISELVSISLSHDENIYSKNQIPLGCSLIISSLVIYLFSRYFDKKREEGKGTYIFSRSTIARESRLFFIPFNYWTYIM